MDKDSMNLTPLFHCALSRTSFYTSPKPLDNALASLKQIAIPTNIRAIHRSEHLISFASHVQQLIDQPIEVKTFSNHRLVHILGQAVIAQTPKGTLDLYLWHRPSGNSNWRLEKTPPIGTPFLDFPRTTLWLDNLQDALLDEARFRLISDGWANNWAKWAWSWIQFKTVSRLDLRRLRAKIRGALNLDPLTLNLLRNRSRYVIHGKWSIADYNVEYLDREKTNLLKIEAPAILPLYWGLRIHPDFDRSLEPKKAVREFARRMGVAPQQWAVVANSGRKGQLLYKALCREFFDGTELENAISYLKMIQLLRPKTRLSMEFWRQVLSLCGTRQSPPISGYAEALVEYQEPLRHIVRLATARIDRHGRSISDKDLHAVLSWIADRKIKRLTRSQRLGGWSYLMRRAMSHRSAQQTPISSDLKWEPVLSGFSAGRINVVPLQTAAAVWDEAIEMRHCAEKYIAQCATHDVALFSLQRPSGKKVATAAFFHDGFKWELLELAGKANTEPTNEVRLVAKTLVELMRRAPIRNHSKVGEGQPLVPAESSFPDGTVFYDMDGVPVTLEPSDDNPWAWEPSGASPRPRAVGLIAALNSGKEISREAFFERFSTQQSTDQDYKSDQEIHDAWLLTQSDDDFKRIAKGLKSLMDSKNLQQHLNTKWST
jgi:hypothetical protein